MRYVIYVAHKVQSTPVNANTDKIPCCFRTLPLDTKLRENVIRTRLEHLKIQIIV